jgi:hypothetical protein
MGGDDRTVPPGRVLHAGAALTALATLWAATLPTLDLVVAASLGLAVAVVGTVWFAGFFREVLRPGRRPTRSWLAVPAGGLLIAAVVMAGAPLQARFALAEAGLSDVAESLTGADPMPVADSPAGDRVGTYLIDRVDVRDGVVFFHVGDDIPMRSEPGGFAYVPDGVDVPTDTPYYANLRRIGGNWYRWYVDISD